QAAAVGHADDHFFDAAQAALLDQIVDQRHQRVAAFQREALLRRILGGEITLETFRCGQVTQERLLLIGGVAIRDPTFLEAILQPQTLGWEILDNVREISAPMVPQ
uniref:hypothetical protein n=1 Tax=Steroidobacter cummioxidans TaxID=1803913 RepID=UPI001F4D6653